MVCFGFIWSHCTWQYLCRHTGTSLSFDGTGSDRTIRLLLCDSGDTTNIWCCVYVLKAHVNNITRSGKTCSCETKLLSEILWHRNRTTQTVSNADAVGCRFVCLRHAFQVVFEVVTSAQDYVHNVKHTLNNIRIALSNSEISSCASIVKTCQRHCVRCTQTTAINVPTRTSMLIFIEHTHTHARTLQFSRVYLFSCVLTFLRLFKRA